MFYPLQQWQLGLSVDFPHPDRMVPTFTYTHFTIWETEDCCYTNIPDEHLGSDSGLT